MTNEEAVKMLRTMLRTVYLGNRKFEDAIECAIKALSEPLQPWEVLAAQAVLSQPEPHWIPVTENCDCDLMDEAISRQAAIDATKKHYRAHDNDLLELIAFDIEQLPSIQPERKECEEREQGKCPWYAG